MFVNYVSHFTLNDAGRPLSQIRTEKRRKNKISGGKKTSGKESDANEKTNSQIKKVRISISFNILISLSATANRTEISKMLNQVEELEDLASSSDDSR